MVNGSLDASYGQTHTSCTIRGVGGDFMCPREPSRNRFRFRFRFRLCVWRLCASSAGCVCPAREHFENPSSWSFCLIVSTYLPVWSPVRAWCSPARASSGVLCHASACVSWAVAHNLCIVFIYIFSILNTLLYLIIVVSLLYTK